VGASATAGSDAARLWNSLVVRRKESIHAARGGCVAGGALGPGL